MSGQDCRMQGMPWISPYLVVVNVEESAKFYQNAFNFKVIGDIIKNDEGIATHCELKYANDGVVMIGLEGAWGKASRSPVTSKSESPITLYVYCQNVDKFCTEAKKHGAKVVQEPEDTFWGDRMCVLTDPNGYQWSFATAKVKSSCCCC